MLAPIVTKPAAGQGRHLTEEGYIQLTVPRGTPNAYQKGSGGYPRILEHRYVMQQHLGRPLKQTETVHHKDGNRSNNDISNLELRHGHHGPGSRAADTVIAYIDHVKHYVGLDLYERAVLDGIRAKAEAGSLGVFIEDKPKRNGRS